MAFIINTGYHFTIPTEINPDGGLILASKIPMHSLSRRDIETWPYLEWRMFDPQLYMSDIDGNECPDDCVNLASYPWFQTEGVQEFDSQSFSQRDWKKYTKDNIAQFWMGRAFQEENDIRVAVQNSINFQIELGCRTIILPSPLTFDYNSDYGQELKWLDVGLDYVTSNQIQIPVYATVAIKDNCLRSNECYENPLLAIILDAISARNVNGVYLVIEQGEEAPESRYLTNRRSISSALFLVHVFSQDCHLDVLVNFFGPFGLVLRAAGASIWASNWYKSLIRFRLADLPKPPGVEPRAWPIYWSFPAATDIHLDNDLEKLHQHDLFKHLYDETPACYGLLEYLNSKNQIKDNLAWRYHVSNIQATIEQYQESCILAENRYCQVEERRRRDFIEQWLADAVAFSREINNILGASGRTRLDHVQAWHDAFVNYRRSHRV